MMIIFIGTRIKNMSFDDTKWLRTRITSVNFKRDYRDKCMEEGFNSPKVMVLGKEVQAL